MAFSFKGKYFISSLNVFKFKDITHRKYMANYELMLIINPSISEDDRNSSLNNLKKLFEENSVKVEKEDVW